MTDADLVGFVLGRLGPGARRYGCEKHTPPEFARDHRQVLRCEAEVEGTTCAECGVKLAEVEAIGS